jgi:hypothetical protein
MVVIWKLRFSFEAEDPNRISLAIAVSVPAVHWPDSALERQHSSGSTEGSLGALTGQDLPDNRSVTRLIGVL